MLEVVRATGLATIQDHGRPGLAHLGVPSGGALDRPALDLANRLVGNAPGAAGIELTYSDFAGLARDACVIALAGATGPVRVGGVPVALHAPVAVPRGTLIEVSLPSAGVRRYLAVAGGLVVRPVLGSRSTDTLSGLGPAPLRAGDRLPVGAAPPCVELSPVDWAPVSTMEHQLTVAVRFGPRDDWFADPGVLLAAPYHVTPAGNRIGVRLRGAVLTRVDDRELPSEPVLTGAIQVPADGQPIVFLNDHPTTGGYPVIAIVHPRHLPDMAQAAPGTRVRFSSAGSTERA